MCALALLVAACGGDDDDSAGGGGDSQSASSGGGESAVVSKARQEVAKFEKPPTDIGISEPLQKKPTGKVIDYVACAAPLCVQLGKDVTEAAAKLGMKTNVVNGGTTPESVTAAFNKVVQDKPDGIVDMNYPLEQWNQQLEQLGKAGTKIITNNVPQDHKYVTAKGFNDNDSTLTAKQAAFKVIADSNGGKDGEILYINAPDLGPGAKFAYDAWVKALTDNCPDCKSETLDVKVGDVGKTVPSKLASYLQAHPKIKFVRAYYGDMLAGVPASLKGAGIEGVKLYSGGGSKVNWQYIKNGQQEADWYLFLNVYGYQLADILARAITGQEFKVPLLPTQWLDKSDLTFDLNGTPPFGNDYKAEFEKLWSAAQ
jgi:ribose transport system substrate-binding protein